MVVPHANERVRSYQVTSTRVKGFASLVLMLCLISASFAVGFFRKRSEYVRADGLRRENALLAAEVQGIQRQVDSLNLALQKLAAKEEKYRVIAGLPAVDEGLARRAANQAAPEAARVAPRFSTARLFNLNPLLGRRLFATRTDVGSLLDRADRLDTSMDQAINTLRGHNDRLASTPSIAPSDGHLSSLFSSRRKHPVLRISRPHKGIDISAEVGEPIQAAAKGRVRFAGWKSGGYGNMVEIDHGYGYVTRYAHASRVLVRSGQTVERGERIAEVGATGLVSGPHLHYEVQVRGRETDPLNFILAGALPD